MYVRLLGGRGSVEGSLFMKLLPTWTYETWPLRFIKVDSIPNALPTNDTTVPRNRLSSKLGSYRTIQKLHL